MLDELILGGEIQETSKKNVLKAISAQDLLQEVRISGNKAALFIISLCLPKACLSDYLLVMKCN